MVNKSLFENQQMDGMSISIFGKSVLVTEAMKNHALEKIGKLEKLNDHILNIHVFLRKVVRPNNGIKAWTARKLAAPYANRYPGRSAASQLRYGLGNGRALLRHAVVPLPLRVRITTPWSGPLQIRPIIRCAHVDRLLRGAAQSAPVMCVIAAR